MIIFMVYVNPFSALVDGKNGSAAKWVIFIVLACTFLITITVIKRNCHACV